MLTPRSSLLLSFLRLRCLLGVLTIHITFCYNTQPPSYSPIRTTSKPNDRAKVSTCNSSHDGFACLDSDHFEGLRLIVWSFFSFTCFNADIFFSFPMLIHPLTKLSARFIFIKKIGKSSNCIVTLHYFENCSEILIDAVLVIIM